MKKVVSVLAVLLFILCSAGLAFSGHVNPERDLASSLRSSLTVIETAQKKRSAGQPIQAEMTQLQREAEGILASTLLLEERLRVRGQHARELGGKAGQRQEELESRYQEVLGQLQPLLAELAQGGPVAAATLKSLEELLRQIVPAKKPPILGSLPYRHLNSPAREPAATPLIVPAFRGGSSGVTAADTQGSVDAPLTPEIAALAESLDWNPVRIYEWMQENIATEWYWGAMKGAEETLHQRSGNDADQAALLIALLRSAGFPARYVRGTIEFFPGIEQAKSLTGLDDPLQIAAFLQKAGIPFEPIIAGGKIANFRIEHLWVETFVPYANYRGALVDNMGKTWIALDTHLKPTGYQWNALEDFGGDFNLAALRDDYLSQPRSETPREYLRSVFDQHLAGNFTTATFSEYLRTRTLVAAPLGILPASLQFRPMAVTGEYTELPADLRQQLTFTAAASDGSELFTLTLTAASLSNRSVTLAYEPETVQDQQIIDSFGGLDNTPSYLVRLRPVLKVDGERLAVGRNGLPMGADYTLTIGLIAPNGRQEVVSHQLIGNLASLGIVAQKVVPPAALPPEEKDAEQLLHEAALAYIDRWNSAEEELAAFLKVAIVRPLPTVVTTGGVIDVSYLFDVPHGFDWKGLYIDAGFRRIETVTAPGQDERAREFMRLSALEGSILENRIFEDNFGVDSISTAKLLAMAPPLLTLDAANVEALLPTLALAANVKADIGNAVQQGLRVTLPAGEIDYKNWSGSGYIKENPETGEAGYMLSGMIAGGMTAEAWADGYLQDVLQSPYSAAPNRNPLAAASIARIPAVDRQNGVVGQPVAAPLAVLVLDVKGHPVAGASVTFTVLSGGGHFADATEIQVLTAVTGIARVSPVLGTRTAENPSFQSVHQEDAYSTQVGINHFTAAVAGNQGVLSLTRPFELYARPDVPVGIVKLLEGSANLPNNPAGSISLKVVDQYGNPVSNVPVTFVADPASSRSAASPLPAGYRNIEFYRGSDCQNGYPLYGECATQSSLTLMTGHFGASVNTILGNTVDTRYAVAAQAPALPSQIFTLYSTGTLDSSGYLPPLLFINSLGVVNERGEAINAVKAGEVLPVPLTASLYLTYSDYALEGPQTCTAYEAGVSRQYPCWSLSGSGVVQTRRITDGEVTFTPLFGNAQVAAPQRVDGKYQAALTTGTLPSFNLVAAAGEATVTVPEVVANSAGTPRVGGYPSATLPMRSVTLRSGESALFENPGGELRRQYVVNPEGLAERISQKTYFGAFGVDVPTTVTPPVIVLGAGGATRDDAVIRYRILPTGEIPYAASSAQIDLFAIDASGVESWAGYLLGDATQGEGSSVVIFGSRFDAEKNYSIQTVLNRGSGVEIRGEKLPLSFASVNRAFQVERVHLTSEFDSPNPGAFFSDYIDSYETISFTLPEAASVKAVILDDHLQERGILVPSSTLVAGAHNFIVDYEQVRRAGFDFDRNPTFFIQVESQLPGRSAGHLMLYPGRMNERTGTAKMLGQTMVHDVLIQDGSLNLSRADLTLPGRGPQLAFTRSYNNQDSPRGFKPLGRGWSHSLDLRLRVLSTDPNTSTPLPAWVNSLEGRFFTADDVPQQVQSPTMVQVNGAVFKKHNGRWYAERSKHGQLEEITGGFVFIAKDGTRYRYDKSNGEELLVSSISDRNGNPLTFIYDSSGRLDKVTDAVARELKFNYETLACVVDDNSARLVSIEGPDGIKVSFDYFDNHYDDNHKTDSHNVFNGYLKSVTRGARVETYAYAGESGVANGEFNLVKTTDSNNHSFAYTYHLPGEISSNLANFVKAFKAQDVIKTVTYPAADEPAPAATFQYDVSSENKRIVTDLRGKATTYTLNYVGNPLKIEEPLGKSTSMTWSIDEGLPDNVMTSRTDPRGYTTKYAYDPLGNVIREIDPENRSIGTVWNQAFSLPEQRTDRNGVVQGWSYNPLNGNLNEHLDGDGKRTKYAYYPTGEVESVTDPRGNLTRYSYDAYGNPDTVTGSEGSVRDFDYDVRGRKVAETDANGNRTHYAYDGLDYPATVTYPALTSYALPAGSNNVKTTDYDALGNLLSETDRAGLTLTYRYTPRNQVESIVRSSGGTKRFAYDGNGNLTSESDWKGIATVHHYDELNRRDSTTNRLGGLMRMGYDLAGNLTSLTDYAGRITDYAYDSLNRQTRIVQPLLPGQSGRGEIVRTYYFEADLQTNLKTETDAEGHTTTFKYNGRYLRSERINALGDSFFWQYDDAANLASETDEEGRITTHAYDRQNRRTGTTRPEGVHTDFQYDLAGNLRFVTDGRGNSTETRYDQWNRPWQTLAPADPVSYTTTTERDGEGREVKVTDGNSHVRTFLRDARGLVLTATDAENQSTTLTYDLNGNVETTTDPRGYLTRSGYDAEDRKLLTIAAEGTEEERISGVLPDVGYDPVGNPVQVRDGNGNVRITEYNALNLPWKQYDPAPFAASFSEILYDRNGKPTSVRNRRGYTTSTVYDALGRVTLVTDPLDQTIVTGYDKVGNVRTIKDKRGIITAHDYDDLNRLTETRRAGVRLVSNAYDANGNQTAVVDAEDKRTEFSYTPRNLLDITTFADDTTQDRDYDGVGNLLTLTDEEGKETESTYDNENRQRTVTFAGETSENVYDEVGNLTTAYKPKRNSRVMSYDGLNRLATVSEGGLTTSYSYDANNNRLSEEDPLGNLVEFTYDELNRKTAHIQRKNSGGDLAVRYNLYDAEGNLKQLIDAKGQVFGYTYDALNRPTLATYPNVTTPYLTLQRIETGYDANNNVSTVTETKAQSGGGTITDVTTNIWDDFDRLDNSTQRGVLLDYGYDKNGNRTSVVTANGATTYTFDSRNRLKTAVVGSETTTYTYTPDGRTDTVSYPNGTSAKYTYWPSNRVETITHKAGETVISSFAYSYDDNGNRTQQIEVQGGVSEATDYSYDDLDRLEDFTVTAGADVTETAYTFEGYNRKTESVTVSDVPTVSKTYSYDAINWLTGVSDSIAATTVSYDYDNNGNTIRKSASGSDDVLFVFDSRNQLVETTQGATLLGRYDYDAQGLRIRHRNSERGDVDYFYDDGAVLEERLASGGLLAHYRYADRLLSLNTGSETQYYHHDALGSTVDLTDSAGAVQTRYTLDPWGQIRSQIGNSVNLMVFTGQEHDEKTGLIYFGARYYDPDTARFLTQDSYLGEPGTPPSLHRYLYAYSNPTVYVDLFGYISNRQMMGIDDDSADRALADDNSLSKVLALTAKSTMYTLWNGVTGGFVGRQDGRQERYDQGQLTDGEFWAGTGIDAGVSMAAQAVGGAAASRATGAIGSKFVGTAVGGAIDSGVGSLVAQSGQVLTHEVTGGKLGQESINFGDVALSAGSGMVMAGGMYAGQKAVGAIAAGVKSQVAPTLTREIRDGTISEEIRRGVEANIAASSNASNASKFSDHVKTEGRLYEKFTEEGKVGFWPPNKGFRGRVETTSLKSGYIFDRYGDEAGRFVSPAGTRFEKRALPTSKMQDPYHVYEVVEDINNVRTGAIREWFGKEGRGDQHLLQNSVEWYLNKGYIKELFAQ
jgi:RHS repeat-associated protein